MRKAVTALVVAISAAGLAVPGPAAAGGPARAAVVALGDSFISGEGGRWMGNGTSPFGTRSGTDRAVRGCDWWGACDRDPHLVYGASEDNGCHRSDVAPIASAPVGAAVAINLACSGARTENIPRGAMGGRPLRGQPPQADALAAVARRDEVALVVLTVGANDVGFGELVARCAVGWARSSAAASGHCGPDSQARVESALPAMRRGVSGALREIRATMAGAGYGRGDYRLVTMGYASPFPAGRWFRYPETGWSRLADGGCPVWDADADWAAERATPAIAAATRAAARRAGAEFLDLQHALDGHQLCDRRSAPAGPAGPSPEESEWVRRLDLGQGSVRESLHPNAYGQRAIGACIGLLFARSPGDYACRATPGRSYVGGIGLDPLR
jgi:lysophospholipase L1-like esterase